MALIRCFSIKLIGRITRSEIYTWFPLITQPSSTTSAVSSKPLQKSGIMGVGNEMLPLFRRVALNLRVFTVCVCYLTL
jgi:hypothetical protein